MVYWEDIRAPILKIQINQGYVCYILEECLAETEKEHEFTDQFINQVSTVVEHNIRKRIGTCETIPIKTMIVEAYEMLTGIDVL